MLKNNEYEVVNAFLLLNKLMNWKLKIILAPTIELIYYKIIASKNT